MAAAHHLQWRRGRAEHLDIAGRRDAAGEAAGEALGLGGIGAGDDDAGELAIGWQAGGLANAFFMIEEAVAVAALERLHQRVIGDVGLDHCPAGLFAAPVGDILAGWSAAAPDLLSWDAWRDAFSKLPDSEYWERFLDRHRFTPFGDIAPYVKWYDIRATAKRNRDWAARNR